VVNKEMKDIKWSNSTRLGLTTIIAVVMITLALHDMILLANLLLMVVGLLTAFIISFVTSEFILFVLEMVRK
jgi:uncharacterized membrane protein YgaE (UPF0421/DUF939 family)